MRYNLDRNTAVIGTIIEARMNSTRLPGKVLLEASGKALLAHLVERVRKVRFSDRIVLATTKNRADDCLVEFAKANGIEIYRGSEHDVLDRVASAAEVHKLDVIVEVMGDCPLIDPRSIEDVIQAFWESRPDYASAALSQTYPAGTEAQVYPARLLQEINKMPLTAEEREHVTLHIYRNPHLYKVLAVRAPADRAGYGTYLTLDEEADYELIRRVFEELYPSNPEFSIADILFLLSKQPEIAEINSAVKRTKVTK